MVTLTLYRQAGERYYAFELEGHAGYAEPGEDIVCAALTALGTTLIGAVEDLLEVDCEYVAGPGLISLEVPGVGSYSEAMEEKIDLLFRAFGLGCRQVYESLEDGSSWIRIEEMELSEEDYYVED